MILPTLASWLRLTVISIWIRSTPSCRLPSWRSFDPSGSSCGARRPRQRHTVRRNFIHSTTRAIAPLFTRYDEYLAMVKDFLRL